ncbi:Fe-S cluster protein [Solemya velum gill symbiont]|uniref:Ion-translocating oxidoreductase complex subunit B n=2 Tax=Solemya velum gill symbiont TaxID=2340 RepID=A0A1T2NUY4_SOVGS|nr:(Fe-S)-binding protein [Solemya velum gill symbiont]OOY35482.1 Fe-S cluster protein [Solemya velum gill symbiont]OOY38564.1 Fe-S cluster protein [Solemya velum gill symbiont]OOY39293.1 Fe-S cluster protein [Solemya velum gill symbiont]OOY43419.1 Fe-S cluster protein [Solemya velum gill symbiont]OOY48942.1 Fe-S cluster protein [Solemya velum gill symbiont]
MAIALGYMLALGVVLAALLVIANRFLFVFQDPRIDEVESALPHTNCGACGEAGCRIFAEKLIVGDVQPGQCTVNSHDNSKAIADYLGVELGGQEKRVARLACAGGKHVAQTRALYTGLHSCRGAAIVGGGGKGCAWGCLGMGDCEDVCELDAIAMDDHGLPIVDSEKCTACGDCVEICPRQLFELHPVSHRLWVACKNLDSDDDAEIECEVACTACERCATDSPEGLITIKDNLAVIDYRKNALASRVGIERCPTGAIVWINQKDEIEKGAKAKSIIRKQALPLRRA